MTLTNNGHQRIDHSDRSEKDWCPYRSGKDDTGVENRIGLNWKPFIRLVLNNRQMVVAFNVAGKSSSSFWTRLQLV